MAETSGVPAEVQALIALFDEELAGVKFADLDVEVLRAAAEQVKARQLEVARVEAALFAASEALAADADSLLRKAQRAQAYLRVYAEASAPLAVKVEAIALPRPRRAASASTVESAAPGAPDASPPRKRGRPRKVTGASLFDEAAAPASV